MISLFVSPPPPTLGDVAIQSRFDGRQRLIVVAGTVVLVTALALILAVQAYHTLLEETFRERSLAYAQAFAASAGTWVEPLDIEMLRAASQFLLVGSDGEVQAREECRQPRLVPDRHCRRCSRANACRRQGGR